MNEQSRAGMLNFLSAAIGDVLDGKYRRVDDATDTYHISVYMVGSFIRIDIHQLTAEEKDEQSADNLINSSV